MSITFHDVSHFQGDYKPTGPTCAKATQGSTFTDPQYAGIRSRTLAGGWPFLAYHFLGHGNIAAQVAHVINVVGHGQPVMLDVEFQDGQPDATMTDVLNFADAYSHAGGLVTLCYLPHWYWTGHLHSPNLTGLTARHIGLVSSLYDHGHADDGPGWAPYGGVTPVVWQYTAVPLDTNTYKGTQPQLAHLFAQGTRPLPAPSTSTPEEDMQLTDPINLPAGFSTKTTTVAGLLQFLASSALTTRNNTAAVLKEMDPDALAAAIVAKLPAGSADVTAIKTALAEVLNDATVQVTVPAAG